MVLLGLTVRTVAAVNPIPPKCYVNRMHSIHSVYVYVCMVCIVCIVYTSDSGM